MRKENLAKIFDERGVLYEFKTVSKTNGVTEEAVIINVGNVSPVVYLKPFEDVSDEEAADGILSLAERDVSINFCMEDFLNWNEAKKHIARYIVSSELNDMTGIPHRPLGNTDLCICYKYRVNIEEDGQGAIRLKDEIIKSWGITEEELYEASFVDTPDCKSIVEVLREMMEMPEEMPPIDEESVMFVCTNEQKLDGANVLSDNSFMKELSDRFGEYFILPSSLHEVLIVPKNSRFDSEELLAMVEGVNATQVAPNEVLSNHVYTWDGEKVVTAA